MKGVTSHADSVRQLHCAESWSPMLHPCYHCCSILATNCYPELGKCVHVHLNIWCSGRRPTSAVGGATRPAAVKSQSSYSGAANESEIQEKVHQLENNLALATQKESEVTQVRSGCTDMLLDNQSTIQRLWCLLWLQLCRKQLSRPPLRSHGTLLLFLPCCIFCVSSKTQSERKVRLCRKARSSPGPYFLVPACSSCLFSGLSVCVGSVSDSAVGVVTMRRNTEYCL